jgi:histidinol-phosphatase (PHP family)
MPQSGPMPPLDSHVHSEWSWDTQTGSMERSCERALALGLPAIAFTEHADFTVWGENDPGGWESNAADDRPGGPGGADRSLASDGEASQGEASHGGGGLALPGRTRMRPLDVSGYQAAVQLCRERFRDLRVISGIEAGEPHLFAGSVSAVLKAAPFERVLGSLHCLRHDGRLSYVDSLFPVLGAQDLMRRYFAELLRLIEGSDVFEVLAHVDFPRRQWPPGAPPFEERAFEEEYREVFGTLASSGRVLEINTASPLASAQLVRWWHEAGGAALSFGSDAHNPYRVGDKFDQAVAVAEAAGFRPGRDRFDFWRR